MRSLYIKKTFTEETESFTLSGELLVISEQHKYVNTL